MKVMDDHQESLELEDTHHKIESRVTLKFNNYSVEKDYKNAVFSGISKILGINLYDDYSNYNKVYLGVSFIYVISYIYSYAEDYLDNRPLIFRLSLLLSLTFIQTVFFIAIYSFKLNPRKVSHYYQVFYICTSLVIVLNTDQVVKSIFAIKLKSQFNSLLGILPLVYSSQFTVFKDFLRFFFGNVSIILFYLLVSYILEPNASDVFVEVLFISLAVLTETLKFYGKEKSARQRFLMMRQFLDPLGLQDRSSSPKTHIEEISKMVKETAEIIKSLPNKNIECLLSFQHIMDNLGSITRLIGSRASVYSFNIDNLGESIDDEDKTYIKEVCSSQIETPRISSGKVQLMKSAEILADIETAELGILLKRIGKEWNFDTFNLIELTKNSPLLSVGEFCMKRFNIDITFKVPESITSGFFKALQDLYKPNPYHNASHAADVLCSYLFIVRQSIISDVILDYELFSVILACTAHDVAHPGFTNRFLINTKDDLAILCKGYLDNDQSILEMMHCSTLFSLAKKPEFGIFDYASAEQVSNIRALVIEIILATDMAKHFDLVGKFKAKIMSLSSIDFTCVESRIEVLKIIMKAADVGHAAKNAVLHKKWSHLIIQEFFNQGDLEKAKGLPVSMYCDKMKTDIAKSQIGFIKNIVLPIYDSLHSSLKSQPVQEFCINQLEINIISWDLPSDKKRGKTHFEPKKREKNRGELTVKSKGSLPFL